MDYRTTRRLRRVRGALMAVIMIGAVLRAGLWWRDHHMPGSRLLDDDAAAQAPGSR